MHVDDETSCSPAIGWCLPATALHGVCMDCISVEMSTGHFTPLGPLRATCTTVIGLHCHEKLSRVPGNTHSTANTPLPPLPPAPCSPLTRRRRALRALLTVNGSKVQRPYTIQHHSFVTTAHSITLLSSSCWHVRSVRSCWRVSSWAS